MILEGIKQLMSLNYGRTFAIGIPKEWIMHHKLEPKSKICYVADEALVIYPEDANIDIKKILEAIKPKGEK
jgi:hypothetical protein